MHLVTILAFVIIFWRAEQPEQWLLVGEDDVLWTLLIVLAQPPLLGVAAWLSARRAHRLHVEQPDAPQVAQQFHHRTTVWLRTAILVGFAVMVLLTRWPTWFAFQNPALQTVGDLIVLSPFVSGVIAVWLAAYPLERALRARTVGLVAEVGKEQGKPWRLGAYLDFNLRYHLLIIVVPMTLIVFAANITRGYESVLQEWSGWPWTPDLLLGVVALGVFIVSPLILVRIWRTVSLEAGPVRERLEAVCGRIGLRCRDILIWHSDGMIINAAVMGLLPPVRFVLLSDGLLATMEVRQIEAVFGHEAGHVQHRHIQHFLVFAFVGWLLIAAVMELVARASAEPHSSFALSVLTVQAIGVAGGIIFWGVGFGWMSRRFERQADLFGARCVTPSEAGCSLPCSVHPDERSLLTGSGRVCATGAAVFASALNRVAALNGIPSEERSWRHSSIGSRIRFLTSLAGDPHRGARFERLIRRLKIAMFALAIVGSAVWLYYWTVVPEPAILRLQAGGP
ncbi:MAG: M48 family metalloprotease [Phycisphaerales bacterium]|nr:MAG: M48 family metalloprotease [Phycisphaerales bacterium]